MPLPERPTLLPHVFARRHLTRTGKLVLLIDTEARVSHPIAERSWRVLSAMDGSRDLDGIVRRVRIEGGRVDRAEVEAFVAELVAAGLVGDAPADEDARGPVPARRSSLPPAPSADETPRPVEALEGFALHCDGRGSCCRLYPTVAFSPLEAARARVACPDVLDAGHVESRAFTPLSGLDPTLLAVGLVRGRCAYLGEDGRCGVHRAAGASAKPLGCRTYPARFVDDGEVVRVSPWFECTCVARSAVERPAHGEPLVPVEVTSTAALSPGIHVERLPERIAVAEGHGASRAELARWSRTLATACPRELDGVAAFASLARVLTDAGLDEARALEALRSPVAPDPEELRPFVRAIGARADQLANQAFRDPDDLARRAATALATACTLAEDCLDELSDPAPAYARVEAAYLRTTLFGHQLAASLGRDRHLAVACLDRSIRLVAARALGVVARLGELDDPAFAEPQALVEALMRGYGLSAYLVDAAG
jgi:lysine-N-methylase